MMQIKRIKCPNCGVALEVRNTQNETLKQLKCPRCSAILQVKFEPQQAPMEAHTIYGPSGQYFQSNNGETQLGGPAFNNSAETQLASPSPKATSAKPTVPTLPQLQYQGVGYQLSEGRNIIGRKGVTSQATVQIATDDRYMSRQHCSIQVTVLPDGSVKAVLSNYQNKNLTAVEGTPIDTGDEIRLTNGNSITMGHTTVTFKE